MIKVNSGGYNDIQYYSRYNRIDKYEILDHNSRIVESGSTYIIGYGGKINHTGITYQFIPNNLYSYKAYFISGGTYLAVQLYLKTIFDRLSDYIIPDRKNTFKVKGKFISGTTTTSTTLAPITTTTTTLVPITTTTTTLVPITTTTTTLVPITTTTTTTETPTTTTTTTTAIQYVTDGLIVYLDGRSYTSGVYWNDISGNGNDFILNNDPTYILDENAFYFSGKTTHQYITRTGITLTDTCTVVLYLKYNSAEISEQYGYVFISADNVDLYVARNPEYFYSKQVGTPNYYNDLVETQSFINDTYYMLEFKNVDLTNEDLYNNGLNLFSYLFASDFDFRGYVKAVMIYDKVLTSEESTQNYNYFNNITPIPTTTTTTTTETPTTTTTTTGPTTTFIMEVTIPSDNYKFTMPLLDGYWYDFDVDWGDGNITHVTSTLFDRPYASVTIDPNASNIYQYAGVYNISIDGLCETLSTQFVDYYITKIIKWGNIGLKVVDFSYNLITEVADDIDGCLALVTDFSYTFLGALFTTVPENLFKYATGATNFYCTFQNTALTSIPENLFSYNINIDSFFGTFGFTPITSVPENIFKYNTLVTNFDYTFQNCSSLASIPSGLFYYNTNVTSFSRTFTSCTFTNIPAGLFDSNTLVTSFLGCFVYSQVTAIPTGLFDYNVNVTNFQDCFAVTPITSIPSGLFDNNPLVESFWSCFNSTLITSIPEGLFNNNTLAVYFVDCFYNTPITSIPSGLFDYCTEITYMDNCFRNTQITSIPTGLFDNCTKIASFFATFYNCNYLTSIPAGLFDYCTEIVIFNGTFQYTSITTIPSGLFDNCINVVSFSTTFSNNNYLTTIPADLFKYNTLVTNFEFVFGDCAITSIPAGLFDYNVDIDNLQGAFQSNSSITSAVPELWNMYPTALHTNCFYGCTNATNYGDIPNDWK